MDEGIFLKVVRPTKKREEKGKKRCAP